MAPSQSSIGDYTILPIRLPSNPVLPSLPKDATHTLYLRPHSPKVPTEDDSRSLFLANIPIDSTPQHFRAIFSSLIGAGKFEDISLGHDRKDMANVKALVAAQGKAGGAGGGRKRKRDEADAQEAEDTPLPPVWDREVYKSGSTAVVVLVDEKSVELTLKAIRKLHKSSSPSWPVWGAGTSSKVPALGSARYANHHRLRYPDPVELQAHVDEFMTAFGRREEAAAEEAKRRRNEPDEDGFVTVTRGGRVGPARAEEAERKRVEMEEKQKREREEREKSGFYRWQVRERKKGEQKALVEQFEEDRRRVATMREKRGKFRPEN